MKNKKKKHAFHVVTRSFHGSCALRATTPETKTNNKRRGREPACAAPLLVPAAASPNNTQSQRTPPCPFKLSPRFGIQKRQQAQEVASTNQPQKSPTTDQHPYTSINIPTTGTNERTNERIPPKPKYATKQSTAPRITASSSA